MADPDPNAQAPEVRPEIARLLRERDRLATMRYAANTVDGYRYAWSIFERWCRRMIAEHTGHRSLDTLKLYFRRTRIWQANPTGMVGL